jgi:hypothetical protein
MVLLANSFWITFIQRGARCFEILVYSRSIVLAFFERVEHFQQQHKWQPQVDSAVGRTLLLQLLQRGMSWSWQELHE